MIPPRWMLRILWAEDKLLSRLSGGRLALPNRSGGILRTLFLRTIGRRSGEPKRNGLYYVEDGPNLGVVASNAGRDAEPAWWLNLQAQPDAEVEVGKEVRPIRARRATTEEAARIWQQFVAGDSGYAEYERRTTRAIPVVILEPR